MEQIRILDAMSVCPMPWEDKILCLFTYCIHLTSHVGEYRETERGERRERGGTDNIE